MNKTNITKAELQNFHIYTLQIRDTLPLSFPFSSVREIINRVDETQKIFIAPISETRLGMRWFSTECREWLITHFPDDFTEVFYDWFYQQQSIVFTREQFANMFTGFNSKVADKQYEKMRYNEWKKLKSIVQQQHPADVAKITPHQPTMTIAWRDEKGNLQFNFFEDPEFKRYIKDNYFNEPVEERKDEEKMDIMKKFDFGSCEGDAVRFSPFGLAVKNQSGTWVAYNKDTHEIMDVDVFNFDGSSKFFYKVPVAISQIQVGDIVIHQRKLMVVMDVMNDTLNVIDPVAGEAKTIVLTKSMFGFNFVTKVISLVDFGGTANAENPFGNILPFLLMSEDKDIDPMMMLALSGSLGAEMNPMMLYALAGDRKSNDMLPLLMMTNKDMFKF